MSAGFPWDWLLPALPVLPVSPEPEQVIVSAIAAMAMGAYIDLRRTRGRPNGSVLIGIPVVGGAYALTATLDNVNAAERLQRGRRFLVANGADAFIFLMEAWRLTRQTVDHFPGNFALAPDRRSSLVCTWSDARAKTSGALVAEVKKRSGRVKEPQLVDMQGLVMDFLPRWN